jgi:hypothetical protein
MSIVIRHWGDVLSVGPFRFTAFDKFLADVAEGLLGALFVALTLSNADWVAAEGDYFSTFRS